MSEQMIKIDVEKIMEEIRQNIKEKGYSSDLLSFQDVEIGNKEDTQFNINELANCVHNANKSCRVEYYHQIIPNRGLKNVVKKGIRKCLRFLIHPLTEIQNQHNADSVRTLNQMNLFILEQMHRNEEYEKRIEELEEKLKN